MPKDTATTEELKSKLPVERVEQKVGERYTTRLVSPDTVKKANGDVVPKFLMSFDAPTEQEALNNMYQTLKAIGYNEVTKQVP